MFYSNTEFSRKLSLVLKAAQIEHFILYIWSPRATLYHLKKINSYRSTSNVIDVNIIKNI